MKGNGKPRVNMAMTLLNLLTFKSTQRQLIDSQTRDALGLALAQAAPRRARATARRTRKVIAGTRRIQPARSCCAP